MTVNEQRNRSKNLRDSIFWTGTTLSLVAAVLLPFVIKVDSVITAISVLGSWTFFTVLSLYTGQRQLEAELRLRHEDLVAALNDNCATDKLKAILKEIRDKRPHSFHVIAESAVKLLERQLERATIGDMEIRHEDRLIVPLALATEVKTSLDTVAFFENDPTTNEYHDLLAEAIGDAKRRVTVRRLFLIKPATENSPDFQERVRRDLSTKVQVRFRHIDKWIGFPSVPKPVDFGIWDREMVWIYTDNPEAQREEMNPRLLHGDVELFQRIFEQNWDRAAKPPNDWLARPPA